MKQPTANPDRPEDLGTWIVNVNQDASAYGIIRWKDFWTGLRDDSERNCQVTGEPNLTTGVELEEMRFDLAFDLDDRQMAGYFSGTILDDDYLTWHDMTVDYQAEILESWIEPKGDKGWQFDGLMRFKLDVHAELECHAIYVNENGFHEWTHTFWIENDQSTTLTVEFSGETYQENGEGGTYDLTIGEWREDGQSLEFECFGCALPDEFPTR
jgi:hypothetical protein